MQPLSHVRRNALLFFGHRDTMANRPQVAVKVGDCIAEWTNIESALAVFLGLLLHTDSKTALAMYSALENRAAQMRMLEAAARSKIEPDQFDLFLIVQEKFVRPLMKTRDKLAHWTWGYSPQLPNDLLLVDPSDSMVHHFSALHAPHHRLLPPCWTARLFSQVNAKCKEVTLYHFRINDIIVSGQ
jgi:hypothetical protein